MQSLYLTLVKESAHLIGITRLPFTIESLLMFSIWPKVPKGNQFISGYAKRNPGKK
jgi:hypothetical protein